MDAECYWMLARQDDVTGTEFCRGKWLRKKNKHQKKRRKRATTRVNSVKARSRWTLMDADGRPRFYWMWLPRNDVITSHMAAVDRVFIGCGSLEMTSLLAIRRLDQTQ